MRLPLLSLLLILPLALGACTPEGPEAVARRHFENVRTGYLTHAYALLTPAVRQAQAGRATDFDRRHGHPPVLSERVADLLTGSALRSPDAYAFRVLETRVEGDTARLVVRRQWPDLRAIAAAGVLAAARDTFQTADPSVRRTLAQRRAYDAFLHRQTAAVIATNPDRYLRADTAAYVLSHQMNVWRIVYDGGLLTAPPLEPPTAAADLPEKP